MAESFFRIGLEKIGEKIWEAVLGKVGYYLVAPTQRQFKYTFWFDSNIEDLKAQFEKFQRTRQGVQLRVDNDRANVRIIDPNVDAWLKTANEVTREVERINQEMPKVMEGWLNGWCPNIKLRHSLSRKAVKNTEVIVALQAVGVSYTLMSYRPPPTSKETIPNGDFTGFESRRLNMEHIIEALKHDEIKLIGICGMGGTGKTTMAKEVAKRAKEDSLFDEVAMVAVSQEIDPNNVQAHIAEILGLKDLRDTKSPIERANRLRKRLLQDNQKILVILDDIWAEMELEDMGFPLRGANKTFKIIYTSRTQFLWHDLQVKKEIPLELLSEDEAWQLFREKVGDLADAQDLQPIAKKIANECGRLPLALVIIGRALSRKSKGNFIKDIWEDMLNELICARNTPPANILSSSLELSYKYVEDEEAKCLFLLCCLFKEDADIRIENLARYGFGLSLFDGINEMEKVRRRVVAIVNDLKSCYLLIDSEVNKCVKVHDVVRDMGISIASRDKAALVSHGALFEWPRKDTYEHYTSISVISKKIVELREGLTCPNLELLMLRSNKLRKLPLDFFEGMEKLKVLDLKYFSGILIVQPLRNLTTLSLERFGGVLGNVCAIGDLVNLEVLSFRYSKVKELPEEIGELVKLRLLDLHSTRSLKRIPRGVISRLVRLEELYFCKSGYKNWEEEGKENANLRELESLSNLNTLEIDLFSDWEIPIPRVPKFGELKLYKVFIGLDREEVFWDEEDKYERILYVSHLTPIPSHPLIPLLRSSDCIVLQEEGCNDLVRELLLRDGDGLQQLQHLEISSCVTPKCLANTMNLFPILKYLCLHSLSYVREICHGPVPTGSFRKLTTLYVWDCELLENLFELPIGGCFAELESLIIESCIMMKEVFRKQQREDVPDATKRIEFPKLESLYLWDLPSLVGFCGGIDQIDFPKLKSMELKSLGKFKRLFHNNNNSSQEDNFGFLSLFPQKVSLPNLERLYISEFKCLETLGHGLSVWSLSKLKLISVRSCGKLLCVFPMQLVPMLRNLEVLAVESCDLLEVVFELEAVDTEKPNPEILSALKDFKLRDPIGFKNIQRVNIDGCHSLRYVFSPTVMKSIPQLRELTIRRCEMLSRIVAEENGMGESSVDEVKFPQLEKLELQDLPNLASLFPNVNTALPKSTDSLHKPMQPQSLFNEKVAIPSLKYLQLLGLKNVSDLWCCELPSSSFSKLEKLEVISCTSLRIIFHPSMAGGLANLKELMIEDCSTLELVVGKEEVVGGGHRSKIDKTLFPLLEKLKLGSLPNLKRFCNSTHPLELPKLSQMDILSCPSMDAFSSELVCAPNLILQGIPWNGDLNNAIQFLQKNGDDPMARSMEKPRTLDDVTAKFKPWQVAETRCRFLPMPNSTDSSHKVARLLYTNLGDGVLALGCNGILRLWKWGSSKHNASGKATTSVVPHQCQPASGLAMTNDVTGAKLEEAVPCIALEKNDAFVYSGCGGKISVFYMKTLKVPRTFMRPSSASTFLACHPLDNNLIAIGREDSTILIYNFIFDVVKSTLKGHQKHITGLAFSTELKILVSSGADAQLCIWSIDTWKKLKSVPLQLPAGKARNGDTRVQFHSNEISLLVSHETQLAIYDASKYQIHQCISQDVLPAPISFAAYSCNSQLVYTSFCDGNIGLFDANTLTLRCRIAPSTYLSPELLSGSQAVYPLAVAAHPQKPYQFAIGLTDGSVIVMEPPRIGGLDGGTGTASSSNPSNQTHYQGEDMDVDEHLDSVMDVDEVLDKDVDEYEHSDSDVDSDWDWDSDSVEDVDEVLDKDVDEDEHSDSDVDLDSVEDVDEVLDNDVDEDEHLDSDVDLDSVEDVDEVLDKDVDEDKLIMTRKRKRTATIGMHDDDDEDLEKRKKEKQGLYLDEKEEY